jgi:hypothetical protein
MKYGLVKLVKQQRSCPSLPLFHTTNLTCEFMMKEVTRKIPKVFSFVWNFLYHPFCVIRAHHSGPKFAKIGMN